MITLGRCRLVLLLARGASPAPPASCPPMARTTSAKQRKAAKQTMRQQHHRAAVLCAALGAAAVAVSGSGLLLPKTPRHTSSFTGQKWVSELLRGHHKRFEDQFGMGKDLFKHLLKELSAKAEFGPTKHLSSEERLAIFLYAATTGLSNRKLQERFQRSGETISKLV